MAKAVPGRYVALGRRRPDLVTTCLRIQQIPPLAAFPAPLRGRELVVIEGAVLGDEALAERFLAALHGSQYLNFATRAVDVGTGYHPDAWSRLRVVRAAVDADQVLLANHPVPPA